MSQTPSLNPRKAADLKGLANLKVLYLEGNDIEELSSDLLKFTLKLVEFSCPRNKISYFGLDLFENSHSLNVVNLQCKKCINNLKIADFDALKNEIRVQCADPMEMKTNSIFQGDGSSISKLSKPEK